MHSDGTKGELNERQARSLAALKQTAQICRRHGIEFFLLAGSVLGGVRHGGFIPWDDDVDIGMTPENLRRFEEVCSDAFAEGYFYSSPATNPGHPRFFGKILYDGRHCLDVFPVVPTPDNRLLRLVQWYRNRLLHLIHLRHCGCPPHPPGTAKQKLQFAVSLVLSKFVPRKTVLKKAYRNLYRYEKAETAYHVNLCSKYRLEKELIRTDWVKHLAPLTFEDGEYPAFADTHAYLTHLYGDYMTPPPEDRRVPEHFDQFFPMTRPNAEKDGFS